MGLVKGLELGSGYSIVGYRNLHECSGTNAANSVVGIGFSIAKSKWFVILSLPVSLAKSSSPCSLRTRTRLSTFSPFACSGLELIATTIPSALPFACLSSGVAAIWILSGVSPMMLDTIETQPFDLFSSLFHSLLGELLDVNVGTAAMFTVGALRDARPSTP